MHNFCRSGLLSLAFTVLLPALAGAQQHGPRYFTLATGISQAGDRKYRATAVPTVDLTFGWRLAGKGRLAAVGGGYVGGSLGLPTGDDCLPNGTGGCQIHLPFMGYMGVHAGGLVQVKHTAFALTTGPGLFYVQSGSTSAKVGPPYENFPMVESYSSSAQFGVLTRIDLIQQITSRFGLVLSANSRTVNNVFGKRVEVHGGSFGIRVQ